MNLHDRYLHFPTLDISVLQIVNEKLENDIFTVPYHLLEFYNCEVTNEKLDINKLEVYRMLLCYEYQQIFNEVENHNKKYTVSDMKKIHFRSIEAIFPMKYLRSVAEMSILRDIIILQIVLYYNTTSIKQHLKNFLNFYGVYIMNSDTRAMYMKALEYLLESLCLHRFINNDGVSNTVELEEIGSMYLKVVKSWMKIKEDSEWGVFASMFPMLVNTFTPENILFPLWDYILYKIDDLKEFLTVLSIMVDTCLVLPHSTKPTYIHHDIFCKDTFWSLLLKGLRSPLQQYRKQALYVMRRATDIMSKADNLHFKSTKAEITPFICSKSDNSVLPVDSIRQKFFLVYESLEEKQYHLVVPALTHVTSLVKASKEHDICQCFNIVWLRCILEKALLHENNNITKWSVSYVCKLDSVVFDDQFLELFVNILNNSFLYEPAGINEIYPETVKELTTFFKHTTKQDTGFYNKFFRKISEVTWGPVAIFYVIHALRTTSQAVSQHDDWQATEFNAVKSLVEKNLNMHSHVLRIASQTELLRAIPDFVRKIDDLALLANVLAAFHHVRGCFSWNVVTAWLGKVLAKEDAVAFIEETCMRYSSENPAPKINSKTFALMVCLLNDASLILSCKSCPALIALNNWLSCLSGIEMRPYADAHSIIDVVEFISHLLDIYGKSQVYIEKNHGEYHLNHLVTLHIHGTFRYLIANMRKMATGLIFNDYTRYVTIMSSHIFNARHFMSSTNMDSYAKELQEESIHLLQDTQQRQSIQYVYGMYTLFLSHNILLSSFPIKFYTEYLLDAQAVQDSNQYDVDVNLKGKIASEYYLILSQMTYKYLQNTFIYKKLKEGYLFEIHNCISLAKLLTNLLNLVELGGIKTVSEIASNLIILVDHKIITDTHDWESFEHIFQSCWKCTFTSKKNIIFWKAIENLIKVIINNNFLDLRLDAMKFITTFIDQLMEEGENAPRYKSIFLSRMKELSEHNFMKFKESLLNCLLHGSILRCDERVENHALLYISEHLKSCFPLEICPPIDYKSNTGIRALATVLLCTTINSNYVINFLPLVYGTLEKYTNKRYFNNSYIHKLKHRLMQILLILEPLMNEEQIALLQKKLQDSILFETNQHSVKLMQEWLMIRILIRNNDLHNELWRFFAESIEKRPGCTVSVAGIVYHVARLLSGNSRSTFIRTSLPYVATCCLGPQFNMRLHNQFVLVRLCDLMKQTDDGDSISDYNGIYQAAVASLQQTSSTNNSMKIQDNFYFSVFHPIDDYSMQTIYFELPRLTNISCDEWISPNMFLKNLSSEYIQFDNHVKLYNDNELLSNITTSVYLSKSSADDAESLVNNVETYLEGLQNIQRKMNPPKFTAPLHYYFGAIEESIHEQGLIVVASFVNRPANLGGIARTCEIFGVKTLVIANLDCIKDKEFQCLSVSAEKWINLLQVKPHELQQYLLEKKNAGWSLIGIEQTVNSINLLEAKFEKKTILVLGNEKDGIPANFIPLFDTCVEISQAGVIRSLNVHVTAAICIWQCTSQHILK